MKSLAAQQNTLEHGVAAGNKRCLALRPHMTPAMTYAWHWPEPAWRLPCMSPLTNRMRVDTNLTCSKKKISHWLLSAMTTFASSFSNNILTQFAWSSLLLFIFFPFLSWECRDIDTFILGGDNVRFCLSLGSRWGHSWSPINGWRRI